MLQIDNRVLSVSASRGPIFRQYPLSWRIGEDKNWAQGVSACDLIFRSILLKQKKTTTKFQHLAVGS